MEEFRFENLFKDDEKLVEAVEQARARLREFDEGDAGPSPAAQAAEIVPRWIFRPIGTECACPVCRATRRSGVEEAGTDTVKIDEGEIAAGIAAMQEPFAKATEVLRDLAAIVCVMPGGLLEDVSDNEFLAKEAQALDGIDGNGPAPEFGHVFEGDAGRIFLDGEDVTDVLDVAAPEIAHVEVIPPIYAGDDGHCWDGDTIWEEDPTVVLVAREEDEDHDGFFEDREHVYAYVHADFPFDEEDTDPIIERDPAYPHAITLEHGDTFGWHRAIGDPSRRILLETGYEDAYGFEFEAGYHYYFEACESKEAAQQLRSRVG